MKQITASHSDYDEINHHMTMLNLLINSHIHDYKRSSINYTLSIPKPEKQAMVTLIKNTIDKYLEETSDYTEESIFKDFVETI